MESHDHDEILDKNRGEIEAYQKQIQDIEKHDTDRQVRLLEVQVVPRDD